MKIEIYEECTGHWRWRLKAGNGRIVADSGEGYIERRKAIAAVTTVLRLPLPKRLKGQHGHTGTGPYTHVQYGAGGKITYAQWRLGGGLPYDGFYELVEVTA